jgi:peptidoglycan/LPS O-acetylase OafA/YrhL
MGSSMVEQHRIPSLDGLRAIAIALVILDHVSRTPGFPLSPEQTDRWAEAMGAFGVRIFFVISGFLITKLLLAELRLGSIQLPRFYLRRTLRIFLPYYAFLVLVLLLQIVGVVPSLTPGDLVHGVTYTINYYPERSWDVGHGWSLSVEEQFYLLWPATLALAGRRRGLWIATGLLVLAPITRIGYSYLAPDLLPYEIGYRFETVYDALAAGCLLAGLSDWLSRQPLYRYWLSSKLFIVVPALVVYAAIIDPTNRAVLLLGIPVQNIGIAACIAWCVARSGSRVGKILNSRLLVGLGLISYSVYLWQQPFTDPYSGSPITQFPLNLGLLAAASLGSYWFVERSAFAWRRELERRLFGTGQLRMQPDRGPITTVSQASAAIDLATAVAPLLVEVERGPDELSVRSSRNPKPDG